MGVPVTTDDSWVPPGLDTSKANVARVYDYWLGGSHNFRADQDAARSIIAIEPNTRAIARENRAFLGRAVRYLAREEGIRQFLDIGSGIPTQQNVHEVAQQSAPGSRVVYVDNDEVVVAHSKLILNGDQDATVIRGDVRDPAGILADPETLRLIDFSEPVGVLLVAVLHFVADSEYPERIMATLREALAPGSHLVICHACRDAKPDVAGAAETVYSSRVSAQLAVRTRAEIGRLFDGFPLVDPGLAWLPLWRPDSPDDVPENPEQYWGIVGVGKRP
jgi:SAM-dependent methyltransferase